MIYNKVISTIIIVTLISIYNFSFSQNNIEYYSKDDSVFTHETSRFSDIKNKTHFGFSAGSNVFVSSHRSVISEIYTAPYFDYEVNSKLSLSSGFLITNSTFNINSVKGESIEYLPQNLSQNYLFFHGAYKLNEKVTLYSSGYYSLNKLYNKENHNLLNFDNKGYSFGIDYKMTKHSNIGVEFHFDNRNNPYNNLNFNNPFQNNLSW
jgi:hypothetical protein